MVHWGCKQSGELAGKFRLGAGLGIASAGGGDPGGAAPRGGGKTVANSVVGHLWVVRAVVGEGGRIAVGDHQDRIGSFGQEGLVE